MNGSYKAIHDLLRIATLFLSFFFFEASCSGDDIIVTDKTIPYREWESTDKLLITEYAPLDFSHQSAAVYEDYAFFVSNGLAKICLYNLKSQKIVFVLEQTIKNTTIYHCNQSCFGLSKYDPSDPFPLLYISQRAKSENRCFVQVYRIIPTWDQSLSEYSSFDIDLVQTILFPQMTRDNSLGNVNCVIDTSRAVLYTYSRNNNSTEDNYAICKISRFDVPPCESEIVSLSDDDIQDSYLLDCSAVNMQGAAIQDDMLYIGQGYNSVGYIYLNVIDLNKKQLVKRFDIRDYGAYWEPEGCFFYSGFLMLSHTAGISRILKR